MNYKVQLQQWKEPAMSEFKVGDRVVYRNQCSMIWRGVYTVDALRSNGDVIDRDCITPKEWLSNATPEEIAADHRIDKTIGTLEELHPKFTEVLHENFLELMGDDSHIENHISPLCKSKDV